MALMTIKDMFERMETNNKIQCVDKKTLRIF